MYHIWYALQAFDYERQKSENKQLCRPEREESDVDAFLALRMPDPGDSYLVTNTMTDVTSMAWYWITALIMSAAIP